MSFYIIQLFNYCGPLHVKIRKGNGMTDYCEPLGEKQLPKTKHDITVVLSLDFDIKVLV